ncbi:MAG: hypothetical protein RIB32_03770 [Phycisphaerales bacterium]
MFAKLFVIILAGALTATTLLTIRQQRIQAGHELVVAFEQSRVQKQRLWAMRVEIARLTTPTEVEAMARDLGDLDPILNDWCPPPVSDLLSLSLDRDDALSLLPPHDPLLEDATGE